MPNVKISERENHRERGDPAKIMRIDEKQKCVSCGEVFEEGDFVTLSLKNHGFYCKRPNCKPPTNGKVKGEKKISSRFEIRYVENRSREEIREEILETYKDEGFDLPCEEELDEMIDARMDQDSREASSFEDVGRSLSSL